MLHAQVERHGGELTRLLPALGRRIPDAPAPKETDPETERYLLFGAALGLLTEASSNEPVILLLDDLHWADKPTLCLLKHVIGGSAGARLLLLGTYRDSELSRSHPLTDTLADLRREQGVERVSLAGLGVADVVAILEAAAGVPAFMGSHVSRTARIEPVTPPGDVYVTEPFAAWGRHLR